MTPDVNVLLAASRSDHPHHKIAFAALSKAVEECGSGASLKLMPLVVASFLRLVTNPRIFVQATPVEDALCWGLAEILPRLHAGSAADNSRPSGRGC